MTRTILHSDLNNFYASVECLYNPDMRDKPIAVCGDVEARHGIILAKNQHAKAVGVKTGETIWQAKQKCPGLVTVSADFRKYLRFSRLARAIYADYTDQIESFGLRQRFGHYSVQRCSMLQDRKLTGFNPEADHVIHPISFFR